jgi:hypothetical protein
MRSHLAHGWDEGDTTRPCILSYKSGVSPCHPAPLYPDSMPTHLTPIFCTTQESSRAVIERSLLDSNIEAIRKYRDENPELQRAHHFLYDLPLHKDAGVPEVVVMGINPGETQYDRDACPGPTEETWLHDFHATPKAVRSRGSINWRRNLEFFSLGRSLIQTELFFWSSKNQAEFQERFGPLWNSKHLRLCVEMNQSLLKFYEPKFVIFVGLSNSTKVAQEFGLRHISSLKDKRHRLVDHYVDDQRPWFFTKHWSGSYGFSQSQKDAIRNYVNDHITPTK